MKRLSSFAGRLLAACMAALLVLPAAWGQTLSSPGGDLELGFRLSEGGMPCYWLRYKGQAVVEESRLGFVLLPDVAFDRGFSVEEVRFAERDTVWEPVWGQWRSIRDCHREMLVCLRQADSGRRLSVRFRLFDDGLGFRYEFPVQEGLRHFALGGEVTEFRLPGDPVAFWIPGDYDTNEYPVTTSRLSEVAGRIDSVRLEPLAVKSPPPGLVVQTPLMLKWPGGLYVNIHEAALVDFPAMQLGLGGRPSDLSAHLVPDKNGVRAYLQGGCVSPWRTVVVSDDARDILSSTLILNLNEPCRLEDTSWIRPMKYVGVWWEYFTGQGSTWAYSDERDIRIGETDYRRLPPNGHHGANTAHVKEYIDFAARHGFDAVLVEGWNEGWEDNRAYEKERIFSFTRPYPDFDVEELSRYAAAKGVGLIMHHETMSSVADYERQLPGALRFMERHGYRAVKTGYVGGIIPRSEYHDGQWMVNHYVRVAEMAARHRVMVDSHEAVRPTGLCRTWPNWLAQESARGTEFESFQGISPDHAAILPFTRLMGGPMDYTPGIFEGDLSQYGPNPGRRSSTLAKQLALYVTMYSPMQMAADLWQNYEKHPGPFQFIKDVAVDWDDTRILEAEPGDYVTIARKEKGGPRWFVGGVTDERGRTATVPLAFLPAGQAFTATIYADGPDAHWRDNPQAIAITTRRVTAADVLRLPLAPGGGVAVSLVPAE